MKYLTILCVSTLITVSTSFCLAAQLQEPEIDVILELDAEHGMVQVGNYLLEIPETITRCSTLTENAQEATMSASELKVGQVAKIEIIDENDKDLQTVSNMTILSGECLKQEIRETGDENLANDLNRRITAVTKGEQQAAVEAAVSSTTEESGSASSDTTSDSDSGSTNLHMENGVWKN